MAGDQRHEDHERRAHRERDPPAVVAEVGEGEHQHREPEAGPERQREHAGREGAGALRRVLDRGDAGDDQRSVHQGAVEELGAGEHLEGRGERGECVRGARADEGDQDQPATTPPVGERDGDERHQHAGARDGQSATPSAWSERPNALVTASPFWESSAPQKLASSADRGQRAEPGRLLGGERHRWHHREWFHRRRGLPTVYRGLEARDRMGERPPGAEPRLQAQEPGEEGDDHLAHRVESQLRRRGGAVEHRGAEPRGGVRHAGDRTAQLAVGRAVDGREAEVVDQRAAHPIGIGVDRDQHRAPHVRHATASPSRGESPWPRSPPVTAPRVHASPTNTARRSSSATSRARRSSCTSTRRPTRRDARRSRVRCATRSPT